MSVALDRKAEVRMLRRFRTDNVNAILRQAAKEGARAGKQVMAAAAPVGSSSRPSQYYRRMGLGHGTLRKSVKAKAIKSRKAIGQVIAPMGPNAFTRHWVERRTGWTVRVAGAVLTTAQRASEALLEAYARG